MTERLPPDQAQFSIIERELTRRGFHLRFQDQALEASYNAGRREQARLYNRIAVPVLTLLFDLYCLGEIRAAPEVLQVSALLRLGVVTPCACALVLLDWRAKIGSWTGVGVAALSILATLTTALEMQVITSPAAVPFAYAAPIVVLATLCWRMSAPQVAIVSLASMAIYMAALSTASFVPTGQAPLLVMEDLSLANIALVIAVRIDLRDRQVFLLGRQADIGRELLASQNRMLAKLSQVDALTGVGNRRCFDETLCALWETGAARQKDVALVMFDVDHFKSFNDIAGHRSGDDCLLAIARAAATCVREGIDTLARYGGEEFAIILPAASLEDGRVIAERVRDAILARAIPHPGLSPAGCVTVSLGVATIVPAAGSAAALVEAADRCLYAAKRRGRNRVATDDRSAPVVNIPVTARTLAPQGQAQ